MARSYSLYRLRKACDAILGRPLHYLWNHKTEYVQASGEFHGERFLEWSWRWSAATYVCRVVGAFTLIVAVGLIGFGDQLSRAVTDQNRMTAASILMMIGVSALYGVLDPPGRKARLEELARQFEAFATEARLLYHFGIDLPKEEYDRQSDDLVDRYRKFKALHVRDTERVEFNYRAYVKRHYVTKEYMLPSSEVLVASEKLLLPSDRPFSYYLEQTTDESPLPEVAL